MSRLSVTLLLLVAQLRDRADRTERESGATAVEYGLMVALIAIAIIITVTALGGKLNDTFTNITSHLPG